MSNIKLGSESYEDVRAVTLDTTDGGTATYNEIEIDATLSNEGMAADAKEVGDRMAVSDNRLTAIESDLASRTNNVYTMIASENVSDISSLDFSKYKAGDVVLVIMPM